MPLFPWGSPVGLAAITSRHVTPLHAPSHNTSFSIKQSLPPPDTTCTRRSAEEKRRVVNAMKGGRGKGGWLVQAGGNNNPSSDNSKAEQIRLTAKQAGKDEEEVLWVHVHSHPEKRRERGR